MPELPIREWIAALGTFYDQYGYLAIFIGTLCENTALLGLLLPGNSLALLGAFYAREGTLNLGWVIFFAWLGTTLGYNIDYFFGRFGLTHVLEPWSKSRLGQRLRLAGRVRLTRRFLNKHGGKAILLSHTVGHTRSFVALSAGMARMNYLRFLFLEMVAALLWNTLYSLLGYMIAVEIDRLQVIIEQTGWIMLGILLLLVVIMWQRKKNKRARHAKRAKQRLKHTPPLTIESS